MEKIIIAFFKKKTYLSSIIFLNFIKSCLKTQAYFMAEREGFEPSKQFPVYTLSKRAPSATRPPLPQESEDVFKTFIKAD